MEIRDTRNGKWHWVNDAITACTHITHAEKSVYSALTTFSGCADIRPSFKLIAQRSNVTENYCKTAVARLEEVGYLSITRGGGRGKTNLYLLLKKPKGCKLCTLYTGSKIKSQRVQNKVVKGTQSVKVLPINKTINKTKLKNIAQSASKTLFLSKEIEKLLTDKKRHIQIIGLWIQQMKLKPENKEQLQSIIKRNVRAAINLNGYSNSRIIKTLKHIKSLDYDFKIALSTISKYIDQPVEPVKVYKIR